eukprot:950749_1
MEKAMLAISANFSAVPAAVQSLVFPFADLVCLRCEPHLITELSRLLADGNQVGSAVNQVGSDVNQDEVFNWHAQLWRPSGLFQQFHRDSTESVPLGLTLRYS